MVFQCINIHLVPREVLKIMFDPYNKIEILHQITPKLGHPNHTKSSHCSLFYILGDSAGAKTELFQIRGCYATFTFQFRKISWQWSTGWFCQLRRCKRHIQVFLKTQPKILHRNCTVTPPSRKCAILVLSLLTDSLIYSSIPVVLPTFSEVNQHLCCIICTSRKHAYIILTPLNPTFI